jgi:hypothetical protein
MPHQAQLSIWKNYFLTNKDLDSSNLHMDKIKKASGHSSTFPKSFKEISKNEGIYFLILDPTKTNLQLLHHGHRLGGNWNSPMKKLVSILGWDSEAKVVQIIQKSIKNIKEKSFGFDELRANVGDEERFTELDAPDVDFLFKYIHPIPNFLTKIFIQLDATTPFNVAKAIIKRMSETSTLDTSIDALTTDFETHLGIPKENDNKFTPSESKKGDNEHLSDNLLPLLVEDTLYMIQFCHLCALGKISPVLYSLSGDPRLQPGLDPSARR